MIRRYEVTVETDDEVLDDHVLAVLLNQMYFALAETSSGRIFWTRARARAIREEKS